MVRAGPGRLLLSLAVLAGAIGAALLPARVAQAGWWDDLDKGEQVRLSDLCAEPRRWKDKVVTFACIQHAPDSVFQPYFTSFTPDKYLNFTVWLDGSPLWESEAYAKDDFPFLYMRRDHPQRDELSRLPMLTRIEITGRVRDVYRERPWIEVLGFRVTPATLGKAVVDWVKSGDGYLRKGDVTRAESYYRLALAQVTLDEAYSLRIRRRLTDLLRYAGREGDATAVDGGSPVLGASPTPRPDPGVLNDPRVTKPTAATGAPPPVTAPDDLPGAPYSGGGPRPATPPVGGAAPAPVVGGEDLPGVPYDAPRTAPPPPSAGPTPAAPPSAGPGGPEAPPAEAPPAPSVPAPSVPAASPPEGTAAPAPPPLPPGGPPSPPPPRTPRLSGVK